MPNKKIIQRVLKGTALRDSINNTVPVLVAKIKIQRLYQKRYWTARKYLVHTAHPIKKGQVVEILETRPLSKKKSWKVRSMIKTK